jgi:ATP-binding cassette subfamily C protein
MILVLLFMKFLFAALVTSIFIILAMVIQSRMFKKKVAEIAQKRLKISTVNNEKMQENIHNIKEIKILSAEKYFYEEYAGSQQKLSKITCDNSFYMLMPQYVIEIFVVIALLLLGGIVSLQNVYHISWIIASYAVIAAAIFRIAPALNRIQTSITSINTSRDFTRTMILECNKINFNFVEEKTDFKLKFTNRIRLKDVCFSYKKTQVIKNLNLEIKQGEFIGIIGLSGAGKSTLADIIMGLLPIDSGEIFVDELGLNQKNFSALRKLTGYVPQQIKILDGSFKRNIGYGMAEDKIDDEKVITALKKAQLYGFVSQFEDGINAKAIIGSDGLSQGQKQRLAIARVLYRNPEILILDEATSSLDLETEYEITQMLSGLKGEKTIIAIAHRLSTLKSCDRLIYLKNGEIVDTGTFEQLSAKHSDFEKLIKLSQVNINKA